MLNNDRVRFLHIAIDANKKKRHSNEHREIMLERKVLIVHFQ